MTDATRPQLQAPPGTCDCHMHIFDSRFPLAAKARRKESDATVAQYREVQQRLGLSRVVVVQPTAYGRDNRCTLDAMAQLGGGGNSARGVAVIDNTTTDAEIERLHKAGVRGVRFRMLEPPELPWDLLEPMAARLANVGWHIQFQMDGRDFESRETQLKSLPCTLVIEHVGKFLEPVPVTHPGFQSLLRIVDGGRVWVKLSGAYMMSKSGPPFYSDIGVLAKELVKRAPERMVWASNWPHPLPAATAAKPDDAVQLDILLDWVTDPVARKRVLVDNPAALYGFSQSKCN
jgi:D-galactarolactone isomerase